MDNQPTTEKPAEQPESGPSEVTAMNMHIQTPIEFDAEPAVYEIINPSDPYTLRTNCFMAACVGTLLLGEGRYGLKERHQPGREPRRMPVFLLGGHDEWFQEQFGGTVEQVIWRLPTYLVAEALDSVLVGDFQDRQTYQDGLDLITDPEKRKQWATRWHDERHGSMNDIGGYARRLAASFRSQPDSGTTSPA